MENILHKNTKYHQLLLNLSDSKKQNVSSPHNTAEWFSRLLWAGVWLAVVCGASQLLSCLVSTLSFYAPFVQSLQFASSPRHHYLHPNVQLTAQIPPKLPNLLLSNLAFRSGCQVLSVLTCPYIYLQPLLCTMAADRWYTVGLKWLEAGAKKSPSWLIYSNHPVRVNTGRRRRGAERESFLLYCW